MDKPLTNQRQALIEAIGRREGWIIAGEFTDEGIRAAKGRDKRPEFDRLLREVVRGKIDVVAAWSVDSSGGRFAAGNCQEMAIPTLFLPPVTGDLPHRRHVSD
jgi:DNA invertase Pin-like site-specific DNA recombinase